MDKQISDDEIERANFKAKKRKELKTKILATKQSTGGLLIVHTGKGKGKSTAAFGMVMRAVAHGLKVGVVQFVKGKWETGERLVLGHFPEQVIFTAMGEGFTWDTQDRKRDIEAAQLAWNRAKQMMLDPAFTMIVLDELNIVLRYDTLDIEQVIEDLKMIRSQRPDLHLIITGRNAKPALIDLADTVTEMTEIKHHFRTRDMKAQAGIEF